MGRALKPAAPGQTRSAWPCLAAPRETHSAWPGLARAQGCGNPYVSLRKTRQPFALKVFSGAPSARFRVIVTIGL